MSTTSIMPSFLSSIWGRSVASGRPGLSKWLLPFTLLFTMAVGTTTLSIWSQQGLPFQDDWDLIYTQKADGSLAVDPASLFVPANDGIYPLAKLLLRVSWQQFGTLTPVVMVSTLSMTLLAAGTLIFIFRRTGEFQVQDCAIPLCCLNYAFVQSFTWSCLVSCFLCVAAVVPLTFAMLTPQRLCNRALFLIGTLGFLCLACACGHVAYTYGLGVAVWCVLGAILIRQASWIWRLSLGGLGVFAAVVIVLLYLYAKSTQPAAPEIQVVRFPRVLSEALAIGVGQFGIVSKGLLGVPILLAMGWIIVHLVQRPASESAALSSRLLAVATAVVVLMPQIGVALARDSGLASRYMPYGVPAMLWIYVAARTCLQGTPSRAITTALAVLYASTLLLDATNAWAFAKERHAHAIHLLEDSRQGFTPLHVSSMHSAVWNLNKDERFAGQLAAATKNRKFARLAEQDQFDDHNVEPIAKIRDERDGWTYWAFRVRQPNSVAVVVEYTPPRSGPYRLRWISQSMSEASVPSIVEEVSIQSRGRIHRDYHWLNPDDEIVWFGLDRRANVTEISCRVLCSVEGP